MCQSPLDMSLRRHTALPIVNFPCILVPMKIRWSLYCKWRRKGKMNFRELFWCLLSILPFVNTEQAIKKKKRRSKWMIMKLDSRLIPQMDTLSHLPFILPPLRRILCIHWISYYRHGGHRDTSSRLASLWIII